MANTKKDLSPAIRLARLSGLPLPKDVADISNESRRCKKRVELPWQPEGRPEPVVLSADFDANTNKTNWVLYDGMKESACVIWSATGAEPAKVVQALRDWFTVARLAESWTSQGQDTETDIPAAPAPAGFPQTQPMSAATASPPAETAPAPQAPQPVAYPSGFLTPPLPFPALPYQTGYAAPYQAPGYPVPPAQQVWPAGYTQPYSADPETAAKQWAQAGFQRQTAPMQAPPAQGESWSGQTMAPSALMLGDVLVAAGIIPTRTLQAALTLQNASQINRRPIGEILVSSGALPGNVLKAAVSLQSLARSGSITRSRMTDLLSKVHSTGVSLETLLAERAATMPGSLDPAGAKRVRPSDQRIEIESEVNEEERKKLKDVMALLKHVDFKGEEGEKKAKALIDLLKQAQLATDESIDATSKSVSNSADVIKALLVKEVLHPITFEAAMECQKLIAAKRLAIGQAIIALGYCERSRINLSDAFSEMGWDITLDGAQ